MTKLLGSLARQRRFRLLLLGLFIVGLVIGFLVVPVERSVGDGQILTFFDGLWWSVTTITSVGYGDLVPVTVLGKLMGMGLQLIGVLAFGLLTGLITAAMFEHKDKYYQGRLMDRLDRLEKKLDRLEKQGKFILEDSSENS